MNGGLTCDDCSRSPCICAESAARERIRDGKVVIETLFQVMTRLPRWKRKIIKWFWPDIIKVADELLKYHWSA